MEPDKKCGECGEPIAHAQVGRTLTPVSRISVLALSKGLTGPRPKDAGLDVPAFRDTKTGRVTLCFVDGQDMIVRHALVCGRKAKAA